MMTFSTVLTVSRTPGSAEWGVDLSRPSPCITFPRYIFPEGDFTRRSMLLTSFSEGGGSVQARVISNGPYALEARTCCCRRRDVADSGQPSYATTGGNRPDGTWGFRRSTRPHPCAWN